MVLRRISWKRHTVYLHTGNYRGIPPAVFFHLATLVSINGYLGYFFFYGVWSNFNKLKTPDQYIVVVDMLAVLSAWRKIMNDVPVQN